MKKKILLADSSDGMRKVADALLRKHGFEVISVANADRAKEVLQFARPDLILISSELTTADQKPLYDKLHSDPRATGIPLLVLHNPEDPQPALPPEVLLELPIQPAEFISRIQVFIGQSGGKKVSVTPISGGLDESALDAALGLDRIDVTDSEVMDRTATLPGKPKNVEKLVGMDVPTGEDGEPHSDSGRVDSINIQEDQTDIRRPKTRRIPVAPAATGQIEISRDQYGLDEPPSTDEGGQPNDYEWFVNSMKQEIAGAPAKNAPPKPAKDSAKIRTAEILPQPKSSKQSEEKRKAGVEKFIDEFKKEIEQLRSDEPESIFVQEDTPRKKQPGMSWEEKIETVTADQLVLFTKQFSQDLAEKIADKITAKIDADKLLQLIKSEIVAKHLKNK